MEVVDDLDQSTFSGVEQTQPKCVEAKRDNGEYGGEYRHVNFDVTERQNLEARCEERV